MNSQNKNESEICFSYLGSIVPYRNIIDTYSCTNSSRDKNNDIATLLLLRLRQPFKRLGA